MSQHGGRVIRRALSQSGLATDDVSYVETHGTGAALGDPFEVGSLRNVFGSQDGRSERGPLILGAVKTNIGHLEVAAGIAGLLKMILVLRHGMAPPNLHFQTLNPHIDVLNGNHTISAPVAFQRDTTITIAPGSALTLSGTVTTLPSMTSLTRAVSSGSTPYS